MPADSDAGLAAPAVTAHAAVARALEAQGVELLSYAAGRERAGGGELADCKELSCAAELCKKAKTDLAVMVAVRSLTSESVAKPREVQVTLIDAHDARFFGQARVSQGDYSEAAREALLDARAYQMLGPGPHLRVTSEPAGADVSIDDQLAGESPYRAQISPGKHTVEVRRQGYKTAAQMIDVPRDGQRPVVISVVLDKRGQASGTGSATEIEADIDAAMDSAPARTSRPIVGPLILGVVGLGLITYDVVLIAMSGCEREEGPRKACTQPSEIDPAPALIIGGVGVAALGAGILWFALGAEETGGDEPALSARVSPLGAELRGTF